MQCHAAIMEGHPGHSGAVVALPGYELLSNIDMFNIHTLIHFSGHDVLVFIQVKDLHCWLTPDT